jgi:MFS family permease
MRRHADVVGAATFLGSALLAGPTVALCSTIQLVSQLQVLLFVAGRGVGALLFAPSSTVQRWFHGRRRSGVASAVVMAGVGVGALVFAPIINLTIGTIGWRHAFFFVAVGGASVLIRPLLAPWAACLTCTRRANSPAS